MLSSRCCAGSKCHADMKVSCWEGVILDRKVSCLGREMPCRGKCHDEELVLCWEGGVMLA